MNTKTLRELCLKHGRCFRVLEKEILAVQDVSDFSWETFSCDKESNSEAIDRQQIIRSERNNTEERKPFTEKC